MLFTFNKLLVHYILTDKQSQEDWVQNWLNCHSQGVVISGTKVIWSQSLLVCPRGWHCGQHCSASSLMTSGNIRGTETGWRNRLTGTSKSNTALQKGPWRSQWQKFEHKEQWRSAVSLLNGMCTHSGYHKTMLSCKIVFTISKGIQILTSNSHTSCSSVTQIAAVAEMV